VVDELVKKLVVFSILMESNNGILKKAPSYIIEKYYSAMKLPVPETLLDTWNKAKFDKWIETWG